MFNLENNLKDHQQQIQKPECIIIWGSVCALGKGLLYFCNSSINVKKYIEILELTTADRYCTDLPACSPDLLPKENWLNK